MDVWTGDEGRQRFLYNKGASGAQKGGCDFRSEAARRHERIPVNEARCGQQATKQMALKEKDKEFFDQRIPVAIVTITDEEGLSDLLARSGKWP